MDQNRQIRFLIPPFFLFASIFLGAHFDSDICLPNLINSYSDYKVSVITIIGISVLPVGFCIGTFTLVILRGIFLIINKIFEEYKYATYEACFSVVDTNELWEKLIKLNKIKPDANQTFLDDKRGFRAWRRKIFSSHILWNSFVHTHLEQGILRWMERRWSAFLLNLNISMALIIGLLLGILYFSIDPTMEWIIFNSVLLIIFIYLGYRAFIETIKMALFQSHRPNGLKKPSEI